jgi:hypothetical protein
MFSSQFDGERAAAAAQADRIVRSAGLTWDEVLAPVKPPGAGRFETSRRRDVLSPAEILADHGHELSQWERSFLGDLLKWRGALTAKQTLALDRIRARVSGGPV